MTVTPSASVLLDLAQIEAGWRPDWPENQWQHVVVHLAKKSGWMVNHVRPASFREGQHSTPTTARGVPDLMLCHPEWHMLVFLELKGPRTPVRPDQKQWINALAGVPGVIAKVVRPADFQMVVALLVWGRNTEGGMYATQRPG